MLYLSSIPLDWPDVLVTIPITYAMGLCFHDPDPNSNNPNDLSDIGLQCADRVT